MMINSSTHHENSRFASVLVHGAWAALGVNTLWTVLFLAVGIYPLAFFSLASAGLYAGYIPLARHVPLSLALVAAAAEVITHAVFGVSMLGAHSAFHNNLFILAPLAFFAPFGSPPGKMVLLFLLFLIHSCVDYVSRNLGPHIVLDPNLLLLIRHFNIAIVFGFLGYLAYYYARAARNAEQRLDRLATTDPLTMLANRRSVLEFAERELGRRRRSGNVLSIALIDVDNFKAVNDRYGHECGDHVLQEIAERLRGSLRSQDNIGRWGGEEFVLLLPETNLAGAGEVAEKVRQLICLTPFQYQGKSLTVTVSVGVCEFQSDDTFATCLACADRALLEAKRDGKNRVISLVAASA